VRKANSAVTAQVYQWLVSVLPSCPNSLAIPLLKAVQKTLERCTDVKGNLSEVAEFCSTLAAGSPRDSESCTAVLSPPEDVHEEILESPLVSIDKFGSVIAQIIR
jgi:hypothetical protein